MSEEDPIRQLQHLLEDPDNLLQRISRVRSLIGSSNSPASGAEVADTSHPTASPPSQDLLRMLRDLQTQIDRRVRPVALQTIQAHADWLRQLANQEQIAQGRCLAELDQRLLACSALFDQSRKLHNELVAVNRRLAELGAPLEMLEDFDASLNYCDAIQARIESLRRLGKL